MSDLRNMIKDVQRALGCEWVDGVMGPATVAAVWTALNKDATGAEDAGERGQMDARSRAMLETLDARVRECFTGFYNCANATAATLGCAYVMISGNRTWAEQDALYAQGRTAGGPVVTRARGGESNHNFGLAADFGVFRGEMYVDEGNPELAAKVHRACSEHAEGYGLEWGGSWKSLKDLPHYEYTTPLTMAQKRARFLGRGTVL